MNNQFHDSNSGIIEQFNIENPININDISNRRRHFKWFNHLKRTLRKFFNNKLFVINIFVLTLCIIITIINAVSLFNKQHALSKAKEFNQLIENNYTTLKNDFNQLSTNRKETQQKRKEYESQSSTNDIDLEQVKTRHNKLEYTVTSVDNAIETYRKNIQFIETETELIENRIREKKRNREISTQEKNELFSILQAKYSKLYQEASALYEKKQLNDHTRFNMLQLILNSDIISSLDEYRLLMNFINENTLNEKDINDIDTIKKTPLLVQQYKLINDSDTQVENLFKKEKELITSEKPILILIQLTTGERFGICIKSKQTNLWSIQSQNDNDIFFFSFTNSKKYPFIKCNQHMKTTYILSFRRDIEIIVPDACFNNDEFFSIEKRVKFYRTKKHFVVKEVEMYHIYE